MRKDRFILNPPEDSRAAELRKLAKALRNKKAQPGDGNAETPVEEKSKSQE